MKEMFNMAENNNTQSGGIGFFGLLAIVFITLKLTNVITWSWWWVTAPLWGPFVVLLGFGVLVFIVAFIASLRQQPK
jgi:hypothetical protein